MNTTRRQAIFAMSGAALAAAAALPELEAQTPALQRPAPKKAAGATPDSALADAFKHLVESIRDRRFQSIPLLLVVVINSLALGLLFQHGFVLFPRANELA